MAATRARTLGSVMRGPRPWVCVVRATSRAAASRICSGPIGSDDPQRAREVAIQCRGTYAARRARRRCPRPGAERRWPRRCSASRRALRRWPSPRHRVARAARRRGADARGWSRPGLPSGGRSAGLHRTAAATAAEEPGQDSRREICPGLLGAPQRRVSGRTFVGGTGARPRAGRFIRRSQTRSRAEPRSPWGR